MWKNYVILRYWTDFHKISYLNNCGKSVRKFNFFQNLTIFTGTLLEHQYIFLITSRSIFLRMRNVSDGSCRENQNTHFVFRNFFFFFENRTVYEIMWKNIVDPHRPRDNMALARYMLDT
jgi:hypothetical protein